MADNWNTQKELDMALESLEAAARAYNANIERAIKEAQERENGQSSK